MRKHHRLARFVTLRLLIPPVKSAWNRPSSSVSARLLLYPGPPAIPALLTPFFESSENAPPITGMLSRRIQPPLGFSGRSWMSGSGGRRSRGEGASRTLYLDAEQTSHPQ